MRFADAFVYSLEHILERLLNPSLRNRSRRCMRSVLRKISQAFSVLYPLLKFSGTKEHILTNFSAVARLSAAFMQKWSKQTCHEGIYFDYL